MDKMTLGAAFRWRRSARMLALLKSYLPAIHGSTAWRLSKWSGRLPQIAHHETDFLTLPDDGLRQASLSLRHRTKSREPLSKLLPEAFGLVRAAAQRAVSMRHYDVQLLAGIALHNRSIVEMQTGEGKTLTATLPLFLSGLMGKGAHLATANDYLAERDARWMEPVYRLLGMTVGVIQAQMPPEDRRRAYACDITYGTAKEFGFDFLKDRIAERQNGGTGQATLATLLEANQSKPAEPPLQRPPYFILVDEADSLLIDEARTPLIISNAPGASEALQVACFCWASAATTQFKEPEHFKYSHEHRSVELTVAGRQQVRRVPKPRELEPLGLPDLNEYIERALKVERAFLRDREYVVRDGEIVIVDEFTGRLGEGRKWKDGIHQAIEAKEQLKVTVDAGQAARITVQDLFLRYELLAGMTGTAASAARELQKIYGAAFVPIPTNRPPQRVRLPDKVCGTGATKWSAIVAEVQEIHATGRPLLIGTRSIDKSEHLSQLLRDAGIEHTVLNANRLAEEAQIVEQAGHLGRVTVSTNMAGRGTDIKLGPGVRELGGLHVIVSELHDSARIDRQLIGRCGRQGDPGTYRVFLSLDDEILLAGWGPDKAAQLAALGRRNATPGESFTKYFHLAQRRVERRHFRERQILMHQERERRKLHQQLGQDHYLDAVD